ncbi:WD repeat-containing protein 48 homolog, partial [Monomorium pharaonis]|uniref:WD repeat-containing protein 48 homolog n=1 Tax=Monomorium pharaonis TaxID=307658 RepID=UPI001746121F
MIVVASRLKSPFYMRVENSEIKVGYIPRLKIAHGIYAIETIAEVILGKTYINVVSNLDEEIEVQVPTLRLKSLLFVDHEVDEEEIKDNINNKDKTNNNYNSSKKNKYKPEEIEDRNNPSDKGYLAEDDEDIEDKEQLDSQGQKNKIEDRNNPPDKINDAKDDGRTRDKDEELNKDKQNQIL